MEEGMTCGLLDGTTKDNESVIECAIRWAQWSVSLPSTVLNSRRLFYRNVPVDTDGVGNGDLCDMALTSLPLKEKGGESAHCCVEAIRASFELESFDAGINAESALFDDLLYHSLQGRAYRHIFFAERSSSSSSLSNGGGKTSGSSGGGLVNGKGTIGVIGAGTMGRGIAVSFLRAGFGPVIMVDVNPDGLAAGVKDVRSILEGESKRGKIDSSKLAVILSHLESSSDLSSLVDCDLIVEAAFENLKVKREIFTKLDAIVTKKDALILSNTSTLDVDAIASSLSPDRRQYCAGMHFFSPAHVMKLVEVVRGSNTSSSALAVIRAVTKRIKKVPVVVGNCDGFVGNRMLHPYSSESCLLLAEYGGGSSGLTISNIDAAMGPKYFGMAVGPFVLYDIAGNDIGYNIRREKGLLRDPKTGIVGPNRKQIRYTELADEIVEMGRLGQKTKKGWYDYDPKVGKGRKPIPSSEVQDLIDKYSMNSHLRGSKLSRDEIVARVFFPLVNEGFKILEEGIASDPGDIDIIYLYGYGWPAWRGGPMFWADNYVGLPQILKELERFHQMYPNSEYFQPSELLRKCVELNVGVQEYYTKGLAKLTSCTKSKL
jgi:3-hydroxyacyl-CoA dehydrogenase